MHSLLDLCPWLRFHSEYRSVQEPLILCDSTGSHLNLQSLAENLAPAVVTTNGSLVLPSLTLFGVTDTPPLTTASLRSSNNAAP